MLGLDLLMPDSERTQPAHEVAPVPVELAPDTVKDQLISAGLWAAGLAWLAPMMGLQMLGHRLVGAERIQWLERVYARGQIALTGSRWRTVVDPAIDPGRPYLFFQNHINHLDHCTMYCATRHFKQGLELEKHFDYPIYGAFMRSRGTVPVRPGNPRELITLRERVRDELNQGHSLLVFPEGTRTLDGRLGKLQAGVFRIAQELEAPIVPVTVTGMYRVMRKGSLLIRPGYDVTVYCDAPIETKDRTSRSELRAIIEQARTTMSRRLDDYWQTSSAQPRLF
jgi:1-acyl-sn-glycerol-3-phosphate acyltransferase